MERRSIDSLPPELLDEIFDLLVQPSPSLAKLYDQPSYGITCSPTLDLKSISAVSKKWYQAAFPRLINHSRMLIRMDTIQDSLPLQLEEFLTFVQRNEVQTQVESFTLEVEDLQQVRSGYQDLDAQPDESGYPDLNDPIISLAGEWQKLFDVLEPLRLTIIAPPPILAVLAACRIDIFDASEFHMPYHILSIERSPSTGKTKQRAPVTNSTLLRLRPWTSLLLNEGSYMRIHGNGATTLAPPSIIPNLVGLNWGPGAMPFSTTVLPHSVTSFSYIAILPTWVPSEILFPLLPQLQRLYIQFIPRHDLLADSLQRESVSFMRIDAERLLLYSDLLRYINAKNPSDIAMLTEIECGDTADNTWYQSMEHVGWNDRNVWQSDPNRKNVLVRTGI